MERLKEFRDTKDFSYKFVKYCQIVGFIIVIVELLRHIIVN